MGLTRWASGLALDSIYLLLVMLLSLTVTAVGQSLRFFQAHRHSRAFTRLAAPLLREGRMEEAATLAMRHATGHIARLALACLDYLAHMPKAMGKAETADYIRRGMTRAARRIRADLRRDTYILATIAATAPFVGTFGTIIGISHSFKGICLQRATAVAMIHSGLAAALVITALSLAVALSATWCYNFVAAQLELFEVEMQSTSLELETLVTRWLHRRPVDLDAR